jgi:hypothetical protein
LDNLSGVRGSLALKVIYATRPFALDFIAHFSPLIKFELLVNPFKLRLYEESKML